MLLYHTADVCPDIFLYKFKGLALDVCYKEHLYTYTFMQLSNQQIVWQQHSAEYKIMQI